MCPAVQMISHARSNMSAQGIFGSPPNRRRFWRRPVLAKLGLSDEAVRSTAAKAAQEPRQGSDKESMSDPRSELTVSLWRGAQQGRYETYKVPWRENQTVLDVVT